MKKLISLVMAAGIALVGVSTVQAISESEIQQDIEAFQGYFLKRFPGLTIEDFQDGVNALPLRASPCQLGVGNGISAL